MQLVLGSLDELRAAVAKVAEQQASLALQAERAARGFVDHKDYRDLESRVDDLIEKVNSHARVVWLLTIIGGTILTITTAITISAIDRLLESPALYAPQHAKQQQQTLQRTPVRPEE